MDTQEDIFRVIKTVKPLGSIKATMIQLGYPSQPALCNRLKNDELKSRLRHQEGFTIKSRITRDNDAS